ncbi:hypothetical protein [Occultella kanbiaonis]|nr:hypothetical protein [Occultella kanbiaonis]
MTADDGRAVPVRGRPVRVVLTIGREPEEEALVGTELVVRGSTGPVLG